MGFSLPTIIYGRTHGYDGKYYVLVGSVLVAIICVVLSRSLHFQPGYLYGLIAGFALTSELSPKIDGRLVATSAATTLVLSFVAWVAWVPIATAAAHGRPPSALLVLESALAVVFVGGLVAMTFGLLPLPFLPGRSVLAWSRTGWILLLSLGTFAFVKILLLPNRGFVARSRMFDLVPVFLTFGCFALISVFFMAYCKLRPEKAARFRGVGLRRRPRPSPSESNALARFEHTVSGRARDRASGEPEPREHVPT